MDLANGKLFDKDSGAGTENVLGVSLRKSASGGSVELGTATDPVRTDPTGTTAQPVSDGGGSLTVDGTVTVQDGGGSVSVDDGGGSLTVDGTVTVSDGGGTVSVDDGGGSLTVDGTVGVGALPAGSVAAATAKTSDYDTGGGTDTVMMVGLALPASGGAVQGGTATNPVRTDPTGTTTQPVSSAQFPAALVGGRFDVNAGAWLGSTAPTVGQKTMANSLPVAIASDQGAVPVSDGSGSLTVDAPVGTPVFARLSDGSAALVAQKTMANSLPVVVASDQSAIATTPAGNVAHDAADAGNPVKIGFKAVTAAVPAAVANGDRVDAPADRFSRLLSGPPVDFGAQVWKAATYTTQQTGTALWTPGSGKRVVITHLVISVFGTTAGRVTLWFGAGGGSPDTTYTEGTDQVVVDADHAPSASSKPGLILTPRFEIYAANADYVLRVTTDQAMSVRISVYGYEAP